MCVWSWNISLTIYELPYMELFGMVPKPGTMFGVWWNKGLAKSSGLQQVALCSSPAVFSMGPVVWFGFRSVEESSLYGRFVISCGNVAHLVARIEPTDENKTLWWGLVIQPLGSLYRASRNLGTFNSATLRASSEAGVGYWSQLLHQSGVDVLALDLDPPRDQSKVRWCTARGWAGKKALGCRWCICEDLVTWDLFLGDRSW